MTVKHEGEQLSPFSTDRTFTLEQLYLLHQAWAKIEPCSDDHCPCYEAGYRAAQENVGDWHRPLGL